MDDSSIVDLFLARSETAIKEVSAVYESRLMGIAMNVLHDAETARECVLDAYLEAWNRIPPHEPRTYLFAFLARIVRSKALNRQKEQSAAKRSAEIVELTHEIESCIPSPGSTETEAEGRALGRTIGEFLKSLPEQKRIVFVRRYWYFEPVTDIAKNCGMSEGKVKSILFRVRKQLKAYLQKEGYSV